MRWFVHACVPHFDASLAEKVFEVPFHLPAIAAFGFDGHLEAKDTNLAFKVEWSITYPFIEAHLCKEVHREEKLELEYFQAVDCVSLHYFSFWRMRLYY